MAIVAYKGVFGLTSGGGDPSDEARPLLGLAVIGTLAVACVLGMFLLPRWEPAIAKRGAMRHLPLIRTGILRVAIVRRPWFDIAPSLVMLVPLIAARVCAQDDGETGGVSPVAFLVRLVPQCT